jgi:PAS domain S-box-containing protein
MILAMSHAAECAHAPDIRQVRLLNARAVALKITAVYLLICAFWIGIADRLFQLIGDTKRILFLETIGDALFALLTGGLLYFLIARSVRAHAVVETALRRNENRYRSLVLATSQIVWTAEASGEIVEEQPTWQAFTGQSFDECRGWGWTDALHPEDRDAVLERWRKAVARETRPPNDRFYEIEYRVRRHDGVYRRFITRTVPVLNTDGTIREWVGICNDITENKAADELRRETEERYRTLVEVAPNAIFVHQAGKIIFMNPAALKMFRAPSLNAVIGLPAIDLAHPDYRELVEQRIQALSEGKAVPVSQQKLRRFDGTPVDVEVAATAFVFQGRLAVQVIARDITERLLAEEQLRESETRFQLVTRATNDVVYDWNMQTNAVWRNENFNSAFGYTDEASQSNSNFWFSLLHPNDSERIGASFSETLESNGHFWTGEYRFKRADGSYADILDRGYIVRDGEGNPIRMIGAMMDITERKLAEQRLRQSREQLRALTAHLQGVREEERTRIAREIHDELGQALTGLKMDLSWFAGRLLNQPALQEKSVAMLKLIDSTVNSVRRLSTELRPAILDNLGLIPRWNGWRRNSRSEPACAANSLSAMKSFGSTKNARQLSSASARKRSRT